MSAKINAYEKGEEYIVALDAGGTMTDAILVKPDGTFTVGKSISRRDNQAKSYSDSVADAAGNIGMSSENVHKKLAADIYCGTGMLNAILTGDGKKIGLLVTRGFDDITIMEGGLTYLGQSQEEALHQQLHKHPRPLVDPNNVISISERMGGGCYQGDVHLPAGHTLIPVNEQQVKDATHRLIDQGCEIIGILFIYSFVDPKHEDFLDFIVATLIKFAKADHHFDEKEKEMIKTESTTEAIK